MIAQNLEKYNNLSKSEINFAFIHACETGDLAKIRYLLLSPDLKFKADIHTNSDYYQ